MFVSTQFKLEFENREEKERVLSLIRVQSSAVKFIYNGLVALALPLLKKSFTRDFSPLESVIIEGEWQRWASKLVPSGFGGILGE